jgi:hypothetical protein
LVRVSALHAEGREFESLSIHAIIVACSSMAEQSAVNRWVESSNLSTPATERIR